MRKTKNKNDLREFYFDYPEALGHEIGYPDLEPIHGQWIKHVWDRDDNPDLDERAIQAHRNSFKTSAIVVVGVVWHLLYYPDSTVLIYREEMTNAIAILLTLIAIYKSDEIKAIYHEFYGIDDFQLERETQKSLILPTKLTPSLEGSIDAAGIGTSLTGRHYDHIHTDDIITLKDRVSQAKRESTKNAIRELRNVKKKNGLLSHTGTPWHKEDAWSIIPNIKQYPIGTLEIPGYCGDDLPEKIKELQAGTTGSLYAANYDLKHIADADRLFTDPAYEDIPPECKLICHLDAKYGGDNTMALTLMGMYNNKLYAIGWIFHKSIELEYKNIIDRIRVYRGGTLHLEDNADKGLSATEIRKGNKDEDRPPHPATTYHESANKHIKIITYLFKVWKKILWSPETDPEYLNQIIDYAEAQEPDDAADSAASIVRILKPDVGADLMDFYNQS